MGGWMGGWVDGWMAGWMDGWKSCFSHRGTDASPSGDEKNHQPLEVPEAMRPFLLDSRGQSKGMPS